MLKSRTSIAVVHACCWRGGFVCFGCLALECICFAVLPKSRESAHQTSNFGIENGSKVVATSTSSTAIRGGSYNMILLDEFAFVPPNIASEFMSSVYPTISSGTSTKIVVVSTPNGLNHFYKMWEDAKDKKNNYIPLEVHWKDVPGRDNRWKDETIRNIGKERWAQEFEGEFVGGLNTLISGSTLKNMVFKNPIENNKGPIYLNLSFL